MLTIQQMVRVIRDLQLRVEKLETVKPAEVQKTAIEEPVNEEPVVRRGRPRKVDAE